MMRAAIAAGSVIGAAAAAGASCLAGVAASGDPLQVQPGTQLTSQPWKRLSRATSRKIGAPALTRGFIETPTGLAFTVTASKPRTIRLFWSVYCEGFENDLIFNKQGTVTMRAPFSGYPPVLRDAAKCFLTLRATPTTRIRAQATTFGY